MSRTVRACLRSEALTKGCEGAKGHACMLISGYRIGLHKGRNDSPGCFSNPLLACGRLPIGTNQKSQEGAMDGNEKEGADGGRYLLP